MLATSNLCVHAALQVLESTSVFASGQHSVKPQAYLSIVPSAPDISTLLNRKIVEMDPLVKENSQKSNYKRVFQQDQR